ncbi:hypothetical protein ACE6H2_006134 [Prunus campanulata]
MEDIGTSIASKIVEEPVALIGRQLSYLIYYDSNIKSLTDVLKKLDDKKNDVQRSVDAAKRNGATIKDQVQSWLEDVNKIFRNVKELENEVYMKRQCLYGLCPSLKSRYSLSRKAKKIAQCVLDLKLDQELSNNVANPSPLQQIGSIISSEDEGVCKVMGCKDDIFRVQALNEKEAWELFRATVGESLDNNLDLLHTAKLIADECKGLPIAIITVGKALLPSNGKHEWITALQELKNSLPENILGMEHSVEVENGQEYKKLQTKNIAMPFR